eukprot:5612130-Pyramimonas_sp.AAC.1
MHGQTDQRARRWDRTSAINNTATLGRARHGHYAGICPCRVLAHSVATQPIYLASLRWACGLQVGSMHWELARWNEVPSKLFGPLMKVP